MILTDGVHLVSTEGPGELHEFAQDVGLKREWYQDGNGHPHYDIISPRLVAKAFRLGAEAVTTRELLARAWWHK